MAVRYTILDDTSRGAVIDHLRQVRGFTIAPAELDAYVEWRYFARGDAETLLALADGRCVAMIDSVFRSYGPAGSARRVRETSEWYCAPQYRPTGLGVRVLQRVMAGPEPILAIRGTASTQALLPTLGWRRLPDVLLFSLTIDWRHRMRAAFLGARGEHGRTGTAGGVRVAVVPPTADDLQSCAGASIAFEPLVAAWEPQWLAAAPRRLGEFFWVRLEHDARVLGFCLCRAYDTQSQRRGKLLHAVCLDPSAWSTLVTAAVREFRTRGVLRVSARFSDGDGAAALARAGFRAAADRQPVYWWHKDPETSLPSSVSLTYLRGDDLIRPLGVAPEE